MFEGIINKMVLRPKQLFLLDGIGALVSAFSLGVILVQFESYFGMPQRELYFLAIAACFFAIYSFSCYFRLRKNWSPFLRFIAIVNLVYCAITFGLMINLYEKLTTLGLIYFLLELVIIIIIVIIELKTAAKLTTK